MRRGSGAACLFAAFLAGCATAPGPAPAPVPVPQASPAGKPPATSGAPEAGTTPSAGTAAETGGDLWQRMRDSFAMDDCSDPQALRWARHFTRKPHEFERYLRKVLPQMAYVQEQAHGHGVPGEFVMLPWVESRYRQVPGSRRALAGMWQITPTTARAIGLSVGRHYDGRLDGVAATDAVMRLLTHYHDWFQDWRLADLAYNAGKAAIQRKVEAAGAPPAQPVVPDLAVARHTRDHLAQLLGMACVVRQPDRFGVSLPAPDPDRRLVSTALPAGMTLVRVARLAGVAPARLKALNAGYRNGRVAAKHPAALLPAPAADRLAAALATTGAPAAPATHTVRPGETLWWIAQRYGIGVAQLRRWNALEGDTLRVGQRLRVSAPR